MNFRPLTVIMLSMSQPDDWARGVVNRNYYLARELARDPEINLIIAWYLPWNLSTTLQSLKRWWRSKFISRLCEFSAQNYAFPWHWLFPGWTQFRLKRLVRKGETVIMSLHPIVDVAENLDCPVLYDLVDDLAAHPAYGDIKEKLQKHYRSLKSLKPVKAITAVNATILSRYDLPGEVIRNGYDQDWDKIPAAPIPNLKYSRPAAAYIGTIQDRFDFDLLEFILRQFPAINFICAGPIWPKFKDRTQSLVDLYPNVMFPGRISARDKWSLLRQVDLAFIPHQVSTVGDFLSSTDSMKLYEYLAVGLPVIARSEGATDRFAAVVTLAETYEDWRLGLEKIQNSINDKEALRVLSQRNRQAVANDTWASRGAYFAAKLKTLK